ncbi:hypothetical protein RRF57_012974 [Xylaria bambusicola]|uniref:Uncharacterized protein n=1 Tax=Xylaria bambusicola TaxID=326684 RepID=A0AAN7ZBC7_9PEZI
MAISINNAPCLPILIDSPILDYNSPSCFSRLDLPSHLCPHLLLFKQKTTSIERKFKHFPSLTFYCFKPQRLFQAPPPKAVSELRKEVAIDVSNTSWRTFAKLGGE